MKNVITGGLFTEDATAADENTRTPSPAPTDHYAVVLATIYESENEEGLSKS